MPFSVPRDPKAETRTRRALGSVADILNGLIRNGDIVLTPDGYRTRPDAPQPPGGGGFGVDEGGQEIAFMPGPPGATGPQGTSIAFFQVDPAEADPGVPGPAGAAGAAGSIGATGPAYPFFQVDPADGEPGFPGPAGADGAAGAAGSTGATGPAYPFFQVDPAEPDPGVPGPQGAAGANGSQGSQGAAGPEVPFFGQDEPDPMPGPPGLNGATGTQGPTGPGIAFFTMDAPEPDPCVSVPGPTGATGVQGPTGAGIPFFMIESPDPETGPPGPGTMSSAIATSFTGSLLNIIDNGNFNIWQRGTSFAAAADGVYHADRWLYRTAGAGVVTISRSTDAPNPDFTLGSVRSNYSLKVAVTTIDASIAAGDKYAIEHRIEGYDFDSLVGQPFSLTFWVKAHKVGTYCAAFVTSGKSFVAEYTVNVADTWEYKSLTVSLFSSAFATSQLTGIGVSLYFTLAAGSTFQTTAGSWQLATGLIATANQVNAMDSVTNTFQLSQIQVNVGDATPFKPIPYADDLLKCRRYFEKSWLPDTAIGTAFTALGGEGAFNSVGPPAPAFIICGTAFAVRKRTTPTITTYDAAGTSGKITTTNAGGATTNNQTPNATFASNAGFSVQFNSVTEGGMTVGWTANSDL